MIRLANLTFLLTVQNQKVKHYWEGNGATVLMRFYTPFSSGGTASFPGHKFFFTPENEPGIRLKEWVVEDYPAGNIMVYDPYLVKGDAEQTEANLGVLSSEERELYDMWQNTLSFHEQYRNFTGRSWLANYGRDPPKNFMWRADYFGQTHVRIHLTVSSLLDTIGFLLTRLFRPVGDNKRNTFCRSAPR